jgi:hypothetical protein
MRNAGFSLSLSEKVTKRGPLPAAARSPVSRKFNLPVRESIVMIRISSPHKCTRRACDKPITQVGVNVILHLLSETIPSRISETTPGGENTLLC